MNDQIKKFSAVEFNPDKYVKEISQVCIGGIELQKHKAIIQALSEETSQALKKNVYKNYMQFIETAREISHLEGEMYQLSHLLSDQRALFSSMGVSSGVPTLEQTFNQGEAERTANLTSVAERVEACIELMDVPGRDFIHEGDLVELDPTESTALHRCHAFLFSDMVMITTWISDRTGPAKYKFETTYDLGSLAVVNVRDLGSVKYAFKLLVFPDTRLFQCANQQSKEEWLQRFDTAKKAKLAPEQPKPRSEPKSPVRTDSIDSGTNPFGYYEEEKVESAPEWLLEVPDSLDVLIAQRHFEEAYSVTQNANEYLEKNPKTPMFSEIKSKIEVKTNQLIQVLISELSVSAEKSLQGGLRANRRVVRLLNQLGKTNQACSLYLKVCSNVLKWHMKKVKREGATVPYVKRLSTVFFSNMAAITSEFQHRAFPHSPSSASAFVVWSSMEISHFTSHLIKQIFMPQSSLATLAECVDIVRKQCEQLCDLGLDLGYQVNGQLNTPIVKSLNETGDKLVDAVKVRASEDTWRPSHQPKLQLHKLQEEFDAASLPSLTPYITNDGWLELTSNTLAFTKLFCSLLEDGLTLCSADWENPLNKVLYQVFDTQLKHVVASLNSNKFQAQKALILKNASFLVETFLPVCQEKFKAKVGHPSKRLNDLYKDYSPQIGASTKKKVTHTEFI